MSSERVEGWDFGVLLRRRRRAAGLTQVELASLAGLAVRTVRDLERGRTTRPQRTTGLLLADALGLAGEERAGFLGAARGEALPPVVPPPWSVSDRRDGGPTGPAGPAASLPPASPPAPLPPPAPLSAPPGWPVGAGGAGQQLWGRDDAVARLADVLTAPGGGAGPLSLVGVPGVGKTVLALAVARRVAERFPGGVAWVPVDPHATAAELLELVGAAPSLVPPADAGAAPAAGRPALLLLDGVDRAPAEVRAVLARLPPGWRVLTSGRAPLGVPGERIWPVSPLEPPGAGGTELAEVAGNPAVALFLDRLARVRPQPPAADEVPALVGLVRRLGGLPLALELTAVPGRVLRLPEILQRYGERAPDPAGPDQPALRQAVAGSYRLLCPVEQQALRRLSAFRGWWSLELAEQLLAGGPPGGRGSGAGRPALGDPVPVLDRLAGLGLLTIREAGEHRFRLLDAVRDYATEQAWRRGESAAARRAHATVLARLVARTAGPPGGPDQPAALARLDEVGGEVWAALDYATADDPAAALELAATLSRWWRLRGRDRAGRHRLRTLLDDPRTAGADPAVRAWAGVGLARLALGQGQGGTERAAAEAALTEFRRLRDVAGELTAASVLSAVCQAAGRFEEARAHAMAALGVASRHGRTQDAAQAQVTLAWHEIRLGDLTAARRRLAAADRWTRQAGAHGLRVPVAAQLAEVARLERRYDEAVRIGHRVLARLGELGDPRYRQAVLGTVGRSLVGLGRLPEAEQVLARLRAPEPPGRPPAGGVGAAIEAELALARGDRPAAVRWWMSAVDAFRLGEDPRELVEALVGLAGCLDRPGSALAELDRVCRSAGVVLLAPERAVVKRAARATSRR